MSAFVSVMIILGCVLFSGGFVGWHLKSWTQRRQARHLQRLQKMGADDPSLFTATPSTANISGRGNLRGD